jgi:hypothetical protein
MHFYRSIGPFLLFVTVAGAEPQYFGLEPPSGAPERFEPSIVRNLVADGLSITAPAFAPDHRRFTFTAVDARISGKVSLAIYESTQEGGEWSEPALATALASAGFTAAEGAFSPDGRWFWFSSNRPPGAPPWNMRLFRAAVKPRGFGAPRHVPLDAAADAGVFYPRPLANGDVAFTTRGPNGGDDLFVARARGGGFARPEALAGDFNSPRDDWDLIETRDGALRLWASARDGGRGETDIWFSRRDAAGRWGRAVNLAAVNTTALETAPSLSPDDAVLFFLRRIAGTDRIFWVRLASVLDTP